MAFLLYAATAAALLWLAHRFVTPIDRLAAAILFLLPLCFCGQALLTGGVYAPVDLAMTPCAFFAFQRRFAGVLRSRSSRSSHCSQIRRVGKEGSHVA